MKYWILIFLLELELEIAIYIIRINYQKSNFLSFKILILTRKKNNTNIYHYNTAVLKNCNQCLVFFSQTSFCYFGYKTLKIKTILKHFYVQYRSFLIYIGVANRHFKVGVL